MTPQSSDLGPVTTKEGTHAAHGSGDPASAGDHGVLEPSREEAGSNEIVSSGGATIDGAPPSGPRQFSPTSGLIAVGALIAAVMVLGLIVLAMRKRLFRDEGTVASDAGLLDDLREALRDGRMTQEEFDAAKRAMVAKFTRPRTPEKGAGQGS